MGLGTWDLRNGDFQRDLAYMEKICPVKRALRISVARRLVGS